MDVRVEASKEGQRPRNEARRGRQGDQSRGAYEVRIKSPRARFRTKK